MEPIKTIVTVGKYEFQIIDKILCANGQIYGRQFEIRESDPELDSSVTLSIKYSQNQSISAHIIHYGSVIMCKTLLFHIHEQIPTITEVGFEDNSNIHSIPLYYFSIAFNGETWYEKHFNARQKDPDKHSKYKAKIQILLYSEEFKTNTSFLMFLQIAQPPIEIMDELEYYYNKSTTFGEFFQSMPKQDRCTLVCDWISRFMAYHLKEIFQNTDWIIELPIEMTLCKPNTKKYYCPKGRIMHTIIYNDFGIDIQNA